MQCNFEGRGKSRTRLPERDPLAHQLLGRDQRHYPLLARLVSWQLNEVSTKMIQEGRYTHVNPGYHVQHLLPTSLE